jgi:hypothetical protein
MKINFLVLGFLFFLLNCNSQPCTSLPAKFSSYSAAIAAITKIDFKYTDNLQTGKSSWIVTANYYSCDGKTGYIIYITTKGKKYIHEGVPKSIWLEFKTAPSSGSYYNFNIKNKYRLVPE